METIRSMMHGPAVTVALEEPVGAVARRMRSERVGVVLVMNGDELVGIFSERDLLTRVVAAGLVPETPVGRVATSEVVCVTVSTTIR